MTKGLPGVGEVEGGDDGDVVIDRLAEPLDVAVGHERHDGVDLGPGEGAIDPGVEQLGPGPHPLGPPGGAAALGVGHAVAVAGEGGHGAEAVDLPTAGRAVVGLRRRDHGGEQIE